MTSDFSKFKSQSLSRPMDAAWGNGFAKFEKEGDKVEGIVRDAYYRAAEGQFGPQRGFTLELADGTLKNVAIKRDPYFAIRPTNDVRIGDLLSVELTELRKSKTAGFNPTKIYTFTSGTLPENKDNATVSELEAKDMAAEGVEEEGEDTKEEVSFN
jgi:hypothetical protein